MWLPLLLGSDLVDVRPAALELHLSALLEVYTVLVGEGCECHNHPADFLSRITLRPVVRVVDEFVGFLPRHVQGLNQLDCLFEEAEVPLL